jgi:hypothetical protein
MKRIFYILLLSTVSVTAQNTLYYPLIGLMASPTINPIFTSSLISAYNADGNANDYTGYANGTLTNGASANGTPKVGTYSFQLDGTNDYVDCGTNKWNFTSDHSIAFWMKTGSNVAAQKVVIQNYNYNGGATFSGWQIGVSSSKVYYTWGVTGGSLETGGTTLSTNTWYHVVITWTSGTQKFYLNGALDVTRSNAATQSNTLTNYATIGVGKYTIGSFYYWDNLIDAIQVYNRLLSLSDVQTLYNSGNGRQP